MSQFSDMIRKMFGEGDAKRDAGLKTPRTVQRINNISYGSHPEWNLLDVYRPKKAKDEPLPVIAIIHGGAWVYGDKDVYQFYGMSLAERGFAVVNFSYRLAPEFKFPSAIEDICAVFRWIYDNADTYHFDTDNLFAVGDSAGAHLTTLFSGLLTKPDYKKALKEAFPKAKFTLPKGMHLNAVALNCGKYDLGNDKELDENSKHLLKDLLPKGGTKAERALVNAVTVVTEKFPPAFVMTCPGDTMREQAKVIANVLNDNAVPFCYRYYGSKKNPLYHVFHCNMRQEEADYCNDDELLFFTEWLK
ncbi:MAG: alpha/beta hydrolase [Lachnospiraceae bacterium]|nr:alpha/beta hydrolase [Lachnospiraceae bacterium]